MLRHPTIVLVASTLLGSCCGGPVPAADAGPPVCDRMYTVPTGSAAGHATPLGAGPTEARAGRIGATELPPDPEGLATFAAGDFVLANDRVAILIEDVGVSDLYDPWGGKIVGIARVSGGRLVEPADFNEIIFAIGRHTIETTSVTVMADGATGEPAVVRTVGRLRPIPFFDEVAAPIAPTPYDDITVALDYTLAPGAEHVDLAMTFFVERPTDVRVPMVLHGFFQYKRMPAHAPRPGFDLRMGTLGPYVQFVEDGATSYAWSSADGDMTLALDISGFEAFTSRQFTLPACAETSRPIARLAIGGPGLDGLNEAMARTDGRTTREIRGTVTEASGTPAVSVDVHATLPAGDHLTRVTTDATGAFVLHVGTNDTVELRGWRPGDAVAGPVTVAPPDTTADLTLAPAGTIRVTVRDATTGLALPARVQVIPAGTLPALGASYGEPMPGWGRMHIEFPPAGDVSLRAPVGTHRVVVSHGYEYDIVDTLVDVAADSTVDVVADLTHVVDTTGVMCADYHIHTNRSPDASDPVRLKVTAAVADAVEIPIRSEHEWVASFQPTIDALGLSAFAFGPGSEELTTFAWGHFGVVPLVPATTPNGGAMEWVGRTPPEVFVEVRARPEAPALIINHPRSLGRLGGYFEAVGYDPILGTVARPEWWDDQFTIVEVFNDKNFELTRNNTVADWFSLLNNGRRIFAVGSSDSHQVSGIPVGYPRTCLSLGTDDPRTLTADQVRDVTLSGAATISGGIFLSVTGPGGVGPGGEAAGVGAQATISAVVQAAPWVDVDSLEVIVDGRTVTTILIDAASVDPANPAVRLRADIPVDVSMAAIGSWVVLVAAGGAPLEPVHPDRGPFAVSNPIFLLR